MIPPFTTSGLLPPFVGDPADFSGRSLYFTRLRDLVLCFATSAKRCEILRGWLAHRAALHSFGFLDGFQWADGSFCEQVAGREPNDVDLVTFFVKPPGVDLRSFSDPSIGRRSQYNASSIRWNSMRVDGGSKAHDGNLCLVALTAIDSTTMIATR